MVLTTVAWYAAAQTAAAYLLMNMANSYCAISQFFALYDQRTMGMLSNDQESRTPDQSKLQTILDIQASELDSYLTGRYALPLASVPGVLTKWVAATTAGRLYGRRNDKPKEVIADEEWAKDWAALLIGGKIGLPSIDRANQPALQASEFIDGRSRFDHTPYLDVPPSLTSTSKGK